MNILGHFCLLLIFCSDIDFCKRLYYGFHLMDCDSCFKSLSHNSDFSCGFLVFGCFRQLFNVRGLFLLFRLGLKVLHLGNQFKGLIQFLFDFRGKSSDLRNGFCSKSCVYGKCNPKVSPCELLEFWENSEPTMIGELEETEEIKKGNGDVKENFVENGEFVEMENANGNDKENFVLNEEFGCETNGPEFVDEDEEVDVMALRKLVKMERQRANAAYLELEKERIAAATAAEEAMAMILRLQNEKSLVEMEANQYRRMAEEKQIYDQEVVQSLRWIVMKHESERSLLEDQLRFYRRKLKLCVKGDDGDESKGVDEFPSFLNSNIEDSPCDALISSLDIDMSPSWNALVR